MPGSGLYRIRKRLAKDPHGQDRSNGASVTDGPGGGKLKWTEKNEAHEMKKRGGKRWGRLTRKLQGGQRRPAVDLCQNQGFGRRKTRKFRGSSETATPRKHDAERVRVTK